MPADAGPATAETAARNNGRTNQKNDVDEDSEGPLPGGDGVIALPGGDGVISLPEGDGAVALPGEDGVIAAERAHLGRSREFLHLMRENVLTLAENPMAGDRVSLEYLK